MAAVENPKFEELCRLCATKTTMVLAINIFENEGTIRQISKKICTCLPIQVHETDELPKMICENCLYKLELFCDFRERSARTERLLVELYKELNSTRAQNDQQQTCIVPMDHNELIMVQHHQLLNDENLQSVSEIDLTHLGQREGMIVEHEIILTHHNVDMNSHSLDSIDLNNHDLTTQDLTTQDLTTQDLSNQSFKTQESIMVDSNAHSMHDPQFAEDNLNLMQQHQLLSDQFRLQHDLHVNMGDENSENDIPLTNNIKCDLQQQNDKYDLENKMEYAEKKIEDNNSLSVDPQLNNIQLHNNYNKEVNLKMDSLKHEDSNSAHSLLVDEQLNNVNVPNSITDKQVYSFNIENSESLVYLSNTKDWFYCNICGKSYEQKSEFEVHYETHFYKCTICLAVFTNVDVLNSHRKEAHGACVDDPKMLKRTCRRKTQMQFNPKDTTRNTVEVSTRQSNIKVEDKKVRHSRAYRGGQRPIFNEAQEKELANHVLFMQKCMFVFSWKDVRSLAFEHAIKYNLQHKFNQSSKLAGNTWLRNFLTCYSELKLRNRDFLRTGFDRASASAFFSRLSTGYEKYNFLPERIWNVDATGTDTAKSTVFALRANNQAESLNSAKRGNLVTVEVCMSAAGEFMPPMFIFPTQKAYPASLDQAPPGCFVEYQESGQMQKEIFIKWLKRFIHFVNPSMENPALLLLDGHVTHTKSLELINIARENHVLILCFPPYSTHRIQPLDVAFMAPMNLHYSQEVIKWRNQYPGRPLTISQVADFYQAAFIKTATTKTALDGFRKTGIYPLNPNDFLNLIFGPPEATEIPAPGEVFNDSSPSLYLAAAPQ